MLKEVWVYKVVFSDGEQAYERKDYRLSVASLSAPTLFSFAVALAKCVAEGESMAIHFRPPYDFEIKKKMFVHSRRCLPLSEDEIEVLLRVLYASESEDCIEDQTHPPTH